VLGGYVITCHYYDATIAVTYAAGMATSTLPIFAMSHCRGVRLSYPSDTPAYSIVAPSFLLPEESREGHFLLFALCPPVLKTHCRQESMRGRAEEVARCQERRKSARGRVAGYAVVMSRYIIKRCYIYSPPKHVKRVLLQRG